MATGLNYTVTIKQSSDRFDRARAAFRDPRRLLRSIGVLGLSSAVGRLESVLKMDSQVRTGRLGASLKINRPDNVFELSMDEVSFGTNLPYAAQVQKGGPIVPKNGKALAIPLDPRLARHGIGPREFDPSGELLRFVPVKNSPNVIGLLVMDEEEDFGGSLKFGGDSDAKGRSEALYALASFVVQDPRPYLYFSEDDLQRIRGEVYENWLSGR